MDDPDQATAAAVEGEHALLEPDVRRSTDRLTALLHPDFAEIGSSGRRWDRDAIVAQLTTTEQTTAVRVEDLLAVFVAPGIVQLRYVSVVGDRRTHRSSIWVHDECGWRVWYHQGTPVETDDG